MERNNFLNILGKTYEKYPQLNKQPNIKSWLDDYWDLCKVFTEDEVEFALKKWRLANTKNFPSPRELKTSIIKAQKKETKKTEEPFNGFISGHIYCKFFGYKCSKCEKPLKQIGDRWFFDCEHTR
jgi:hypothetical protein